jgi:hypothetical protein
MATWQVYVTYSIDDQIEVEADTAEEAIEMVQMEDSLHCLLPYSERGGYTTSWDDVNAYEAHKEDEDEDE